VGPSTTDAPRKRSRRKVRREEGHGPGGRIYRPQYHLPMQTTPVRWEGKKHQSAVGRRTSPRDVRGVVGKFKRYSGQGGSTGDKNGQDLPYTSGEFSRLVSKSLNK
jgi:hypothetical protein